MSVSAQEMANRLAEHAERALGLKCKSEMALCNGVHNAVRMLHESAHVLQKRADHSKPMARKSENFVWKAMFHADRALPIRRKFMAPFSSLNFSTHIANESLAEDYATPDF